MTSRQKTEKFEFENHLQGICGITENKKQPFAKWQLFIPQKPVFLNLPAHSWLPVSSQQECSLLEPTLTVISSISWPRQTIKPIPLPESPKQTNHRATSHTRENVIQANNQALQTQLEKALARIEQTVQLNKNLVERISRSPRAIQTIQALEAAIAIFGQHKPKPEYETSEYATGNRRWRRSPAQHPVPIQDILLYDVQNKHQQNQILGDKVAQVVQQNTQLAQQFSSAYETPSEKLKKDHIMALVTKTVATYMFIRHNHGPKQNHIHEKEDFSSWAETFFKKKE